MYCDDCDSAPCTCDPEAEVLINAGRYPCPCGCGNFANGAPIHSYRHKPCVYDSPAERARALGIDPATIMSANPTTGAH